MKTLQFILCMTVLLFAVSCDKNEIIEPVLEEQTQGEMIKAGGRLRMSPLRFIHESKTFPFDYISEATTTVFNDEIWHIRLGEGGRVFIDELYDEYDPDQFPEVEVWSSTNGRDWRLRKTNPFPPRDGLKTLVHNGKLWVIGGFLYNTDVHHEYASREVWNSKDGINWRLVSSGSNVPFVELESAIVFNNKMFIFDAKEYLGESDDMAKIYSSIDGINWTVEKSYGWDEAHIKNPIVFKNLMYGWRYSGYGTTFSRTLWKSFNGRVWKQVIPTPQKFLSADNLFPHRGGQSVVVHNEKVWVIGGRERNSVTGDYEYFNDIWYSEDMQAWSRVSGESRLPSRHRSTAVDFRGKIWLFGGWTPSATSFSDPMSDQVWSITESRRLSLLD